MAEFVILDKDIGRAVDTAIENNSEYQSIENPKEKVVNLYQKLTENTEKLTDINEKIVDLCLKIIKQEENNRNRVIETKSTVIPSVLSSDNIIQQSNNRNIVKHNYLPKPTTLTGRMFQLGTNAAKSATRSTVNNVDNWLSKEVPFYDLLKGTTKLTSRLVGGIGSSIGGLFKKDKRQFDILSAPSKDNNGIFNLFNKSSTKNEDIGISSKPLAENRVLRYSTIGIASAWLVKKFLQLKGNNNIVGDGDLGVDDLVAANLAIKSGGGLLKTLKNVIFHPFRTLGSLITGIASIFLKAIPMIMVAGAGVIAVADFMNKKSVEEITGKATEDVTLTDRIISGVSQTAFGNVQSGSDEDRSYNSNKQAAKYAAIGAVLGKTFFGGKGAVLGALGGAGIGKGLGYLGGDKITEGIIDTKDKLTGSFDETRKAQKELNETYAKREKKVDESTNQLDRFMKEVKKTTDLWTGFWGDADTVLGMEIDTTDTGGNNNGTPNNTPSANRAAGASVDMDTLQAAVALIGAQESANGKNLIKPDDRNPKNDKSAGFSIGTSQYNWNSGNALKYLEYLYKHDTKELFKQTGLDRWLEDLRDKSKRKIKGVTIDSATLAKLEELYRLDAENGGYLMAADKRFTDNYIAGHIANAEKHYGITDPRLQIMFANIATQYGGVMKNFLPAAGYNKDTYNPNTDYDKIKKGIRQALINYGYGSSIFLNRFDTVSAGAENWYAQQQVKPNADKPKDETLSEQKAKADGKLKDAKKENQEQLATTAKVLQEENEKRSSIEKKLALDFINSSGSTNMANIKNLTFAYNFGGTVSGEANPFLGLA